MRITCLLNGLNLSSRLATKWQNRRMKVLKSGRFDKWLLNLKDGIAKACVVRRIENIEANNHLGDYKHIDGEIYEMRIFSSSGIRLYFAFNGKEIIILLQGGDKTTQQRDIQKAKDILKDYR